MKTIAFALLATILVAAQLSTPVTASSSPTVLASVNCGDTYIVQRLDYLAKIARNCGTTVANILALNPQIVNPSLIYSGQVLRLTTNVPVPYWPTYNIYGTPYTATTTYSGYARVSLSATRAAAGTDLIVSVRGFPANAHIDYRLGLRGDTFSVVYDGVTTSNGTDSQIITIPSDADPGEYWVVQVLTTDREHITQVYSSSILITGYYYYTSYTGYARVSLSTTRASAGDEVTVYVNGFPANAYIDYRLGLKGETFSVVYDGKVGAYGSTNQTITIPSSANSGEYWVVLVTTTDLKKITSVTSHTIYINN